jgi:hypothetical protein
MLGDMTNATPAKGRNVYTREDALRMAGSLLQVKGYAADSRAGEQDLLRAIESIYAAKLPHEPECPSHRRGADCACIRAAVAGVLQLYGAGS